MTPRWTHLPLRQSLVFVLLVFGGSITFTANAAPEASPVVDTPGTFQPAAEATATETPSATATLTSDQLSINGSEAAVVTVPTSGRIAFVSGSGWIGFFSDDGCTSLLGIAKSPQDEAASFYSTAYGNTFWAAGVSESNVTKTTCRQVSIADPTPTPLPPPLMTIQGKTGDAFLDDSNIVDFAVPQEAGTSWTLYYFLDGDCLAYVTKTTFPESGHLYITGRALEDTVGNPTLSVYAMREPDGATSPCQRIDIGYAGERNTPTPTEVDPQQTPTDPPVATVPAPSVNVTAIPTESVPAPSVNVTAIPTESVPAKGAGVVTSLPSTGVGSASPTLPIATLMVGTLVALVLAGIGWRRRTR